MQRLSSRSTFFYKRVFPLFWFGVIVLVTIVIFAVLGSAGKRPEVWLSLLAPLFMSIIGFVILKQLIFDLVDEVWLEGDHLLVKNRGDQVSIALANVMNVSATTMTNPPRISLMLRTESSRLGKTVTFVPTGPGGLSAVFKPNPIATQLVEQVDAARGRKA